jgi:Ca-activated chloride channel family protein
MALGRPYLGYEWTEQKRSQKHILFILDVSRSMLVEDVFPNRLGRAKLIIEQMVNRYPMADAGLMIFAEDSFLQCPVTSDQVAFMEALRNQNPDFMFNQGSNLNHMLVSLSEIIETPEKTIAVVVSDGEDHSKTIKTAVRLLKNEQIQVNTICVGSTTGGLIPNNEVGSESPYFTDHMGNVVYSKATPQVLRYIASSLDGLSVLVDSESASLAPLLDKIDQEIVSEGSDVSEQKKPVEYYQAPLFVAFLLLILDFSMGTRKPKPNKKP